MTKQLSFLLKINRTATQEKLEGVLESICIYRWFRMVRKEMKGTPSYEIREYGLTYTVGKPFISVNWKQKKSIQMSKFLEL